MKIISTEIKKGQIIKYGNCWGIVIEEPKEYKFKPSEVEILVKTLPQEIRRRDGYISKYKGGNETKFFFRKTTMVNAK